MKRKLIFQVMVSLDGYYEGPQAELDWHRADSEFNDYAVEFLNRTDLLLFGRKTYSMMEAWWPTPVALETDPIVAEKMNGLPKLVVSRTLEKTHWNNTQLLKENIVEEISQLKKQEGKNIALFGSSELALTLMAHRLIDEYHIFVNPVVLGGGKALLQGVREKLDLQLECTRIFDSGNILLTYSPKN